MLRRAVRRIPGIAQLHRAWSNARFQGSASYWDTRYDLGGNSGDGSYGKLAEFKAEVLNQFVTEHSVESVLEFGCGDGHQLQLARYPRYVGLDVSPRAVRLCVEQFRSDATKSFFRYDPSAFHDAAGIFRADLSLSLDVIYHLVEDDVYKTYLDHLFGSAARFVVVYSSNKQQGGSAMLRDAPHVRHRSVVDDVLARFSSFTQIGHVPNRFPERTFASFYLFERRS